MSLVQALLLALLQGVSELFPVSSLGHTVVLPRLLGWSIDQHDPSFLAFVVLLHVGTAGALFLYFWRDWWGIISAVTRSVIAGRMSGGPDERLGWRLIAGTIPAGLLGLLLEKQVRELFASPRVAASFLVVNGLVMFIGERARRRAVAFDAGRIDLNSLSLPGAVAIGTAQALALVPGISRSGITIVAGLLMNLKHEAAARFSFLLATPIIAAAGALQVPRLVAGPARAQLPVYLLGALVAALAAFLSVAFLMRYFRVGRLDPFAIYCAGFGAAALLILSR
jgi:undecaprenyl-diphosphatase